VPTVENPSAAQYERELISARTKEGMAQRKVDGWAGGRPAGRPRVLDDNIRGRIIAAHTAGRGWSAIARELNDAQVPTAPRRRHLAPLDRSGSCTGLRPLISLNRDRCDDFGGSVAVIE